MSSRLSCNSKAFASVLPEKLEEMFPRYYTNNDVISKFKSTTTHWCVTRRERVNTYLHA